MLLSINIVLSQLIIKSIIEREKKVNDSHRMRFKKGLMEKKYQISSKGWWYKSIWETFSGS